MSKSALTLKQNYLSQITKEIKRKILWKNHHYNKADSCRPVGNMMGQFVHSYNNQSGDPLI